MKRLAEHHRQDALIAVILKFVQSTANTLPKVKDIHIRKPHSLRTTHNCGG